MASSSQIPFGPLGSTITFTAVTPTPPTGLQAPVHPTTNTSAGEFRISTVTVFLGVGATSVAAIANAGAVATSIPLLPGTDEVLRFSPDAFFTGKSASGAATVYITPGQGL